MIRTHVRALPVCAEIQPGYLKAVNVTVPCADLPQKQRAMLDLHLYYALLPRLRCLRMFC